MWKNQLKLWIAFKIHCFKSIGKKVCPCSRKLICCEATWLNKFILNVEAKNLTTQIIKADKMITAFTHRTLKAERSVMAHTGDQT